MGNWRFYQNRDICRLKVNSTNTAVRELRQIAPTIKCIILIFNTHATRTTVKTLLF